MAVLSTVVCKHCAYCLGPTNLFGPTKVKNEILKKKGIDQNMDTVSLIKVQFAPKHSLS